MATTTTSTTTEIDLTTYQAAPGTLITALLLNTIIDAINELNQSVEQLQPPPVPLTGTPPVILNVYSELADGNPGPSMTVDFDAPTTTVEGTGLQAWTLVRLDSIPLAAANVTYQAGVGIDTLVLTGLPSPSNQPKPPDYHATPDDERGVRLGLLAVTNGSGTGVRIVRLQSKS